MVSEIQPVLRIIHIILGSAGLILGTVAIVLPKFTKQSFWHRWVGRSYAASMLTMGIISIPLSIWINSIFLLVIGLFTLGWVAAGWIALRRVRKTQPGGRRLPPTSRLRWHVTWMGSSYIAAWTAFLVNVQPIGDGLPLMLVYSILPSLIGTYLIARTTVRLNNPARNQAKRMVVR